MRACVLCIVVILAVLQSSNASLFVKGPSKPIVEGDSVTLECLDTDSEFNMSLAHFEKLSKHMSSTWFRLDVDQYGYYYRRCFMYDMDVKREGGRLQLMLAKIQSWSAGKFRCVADNTTNADNSTMPYNLTVHYLRDVSVTKAGLNKFSRYFTSLEDLRVPLREDVELECSASGSETPEYFWVKEGEDWIVTSSKLKLEQVRDLDSGEYTCTAQHPSVSTLIKKRTIKVTVLPEDSAWYESTSVQIILIACAAFVILLVITIAMTAFLCRYTRQRKSKGPVDDHSQKKPIYRNSVESLPSTAGDKQPLV